MHRRYYRLILGYEMAGFALIFVLLWVDEIFDFPHYLLGAPATPVNWKESLLESFSVLVLACVVILMTYRILTRLKYLEGFLPVCSFCKKIRVEKEWIPIEKFVMDHSEATFSHSLCPGCAQEHYGDLLSQQIPKT